MTPARPRGAWSRAAVLLWALGGAAVAQEARGFAELRLSLYPGASGDVWHLVERVRPSFSAELMERVKLVATLEAGFAQGRNPTRELERLLSESALQPLLDAAQCTWPRPTNPLLGVDRADDYLDVDRLYLDLYAGEVDVRIGRQALNWGSAQFFNPTDPFPEVLLAEPWRPRRGVNAVRASLALAETSDAALVIATDDAFDTVRAAGRLRFDVAGTSVALVGAYRGDNRTGLVGVDLKGNLEVGWWLEAGYLFGEAPHAELAVGIDYSFPILERAIVFAQYYRNGAGATAPSGYQRAALSAGIGGPSCEGGGLFGASGGERDPFAPFTLGRDYLLAGATLGISADLSANVAALQNLNDGSGMVIPTVNYALLDWLEVAASAQLPYSLTGGSGELRPRAQDLQLSVEVPGAGTLTADLGGLVPAATLTFWTRASF